MPRKQMNIRLDSLTIEAIKRIARQHNMSESQVITRAVIELEQRLLQERKGQEDVSG
jgi:hypothetical protein